MSWRALLPLPILAGAVGCWFDWRADRAAAAPPPTAAAATPSPWHAALGELAEPPALGPLRERVQAWSGLPSLAAAGLEPATTAAAAARHELARWCDFSSTAELRWSSLAAAASADGRSCELHGDFAGPAPAALELLQHLLAAPAGRGYLTDPLHLQLHREDAGVHVFVRLLVTPAAHFLTGEGP